MRAPKRSHTVFLYIRVLTVSSSTLQDIPQADPGKAYGPVMRPRLSLHSGRNTQSVDRSDYEKDHLKDQRDISHRTGLILIILHESENNGCKEVDDQGNQLEGKDHPVPRLKQNSEPSLIIDKGYNESGPDQYGCSHGNKEQHGIDICRNDPVLLIEPSPQDIRDIKQHDSIEKMPVSYLGQLDPVAVSLLKCLEIDNGVND